MAARERRVESEFLVAPAAELARAFRARLEREAEGALAARGRCALAISGGSVAEAFLPELVAAEIDWPRIDLFWLDERAVPPGDSDSNFGRARSLWLDRLAGSPPRVHRLQGEASDLAGEAARADAELRLGLGEPPRIDVALAGVGPDGHVASLFPGHPALAEAARWIVAIGDSPKPPARRLTMTLAALAAVDLLAVAALGSAKADAVRAAAEPAGAAPIARAARLARRRLFLLDAGAARRLAPARRSAAQP